MKLLILGTGDIAKRMLENGLNGELIGFVETKKGTEMFRGLPI